MKSYKIYCFHSPSNVEPLPSNYHEHNSVINATLLARGVKKGVFEGLEKFSRKQLLITEYFSTLEEETIVVVI